MEKNLFLKEFLMDYGGIDMGFGSSRFTWSNGRKGLACIKERLDRGVAYHKWITMFPNANVQHLCTKFSDHCSILLKTKDSKPFIQRPFRFVQAWTSDKNSIHVV